MTDVVIHPATSSSGAGHRFRRFAALVARSLSREMIADDTCRALDELPDKLLRDMGVARSDIPFVADALAARYMGPNSHALDRNLAERGAAVHRLPHVVFDRAPAAHY